MILNTISKELSAGIVFVSSVAVVWKNFNEYFNKVDGSRVYFLHCEIISHSQETALMSVYFTKLYFFGMSIMLLCLSLLVVVNNQSNGDHLTQQRLFQFLMSLNKTYNAVRSQILLMNPFHSVNQAYFMLVQEEFQRQHTSWPVIPDLTFAYSANVAQKNRLNGVCDHCKIKRHKRKNCYRLIGYPIDFKFTKRKTSIASMGIMLW
ncbi:hypothetical protein V6Z11_A07G226500 [Gossypium hirsutum]